MTDDATSKSQTDQSGLSTPERWMAKPILWLMERMGERRKQREIDEINERIHDE